MVDNVPKGFYIYRNCSTKYKNKLSIELIASYYELGFYEYFNGFSPEYDCIN